MKLLAAKIALGPVLIAQGRRVRRDALRLPEAAGARSGEAGQGRRALRLLLLGDSATAGVGARDQREALAGCLVDQLSRRLAPEDVRIGWRLLARSGIDTGQAIEMLDAAWREEPDGLRADVVFVGLGVNDVTGQVSVTDRIRRLETLLDRLDARHGARLVIVSGLPPMDRFPALPQPLRWYLGACARRHQDGLHRWVAARSAGAQRLAVRLLGFPAFDSLSLMAVDGFHPGPSGYRLWGEMAARSIIEALEKSSEATGSARTPDRLT